MNALAMIVNAFVPWCIFVVAYMITGFQLMYQYTSFACCLLFGLCLFWIACLYLAQWARRHDPDPSWYTYFAVAVGAALLAGAICGYQAMVAYMMPYYQVNSMNVAGMPGGAFGMQGMPGESVGLDLTKTGSASLTDSGMAVFGAGTELQRSMSGHFKYKTTYCVAPLSGPSGTTTQLSYDIWAVGKGCCAVGSQDYRCGAWDKDISQYLAVRVLNDNDLKYYYLAAEQAASIHGFAIKKPIFFFIGTSNFIQSGGSQGHSTTSSSSSGTTATGGTSAAAVPSDAFSQNLAFQNSAVNPMDGLKTTAYNTFLRACAVAAIFCAFGVCMMSARFAFLGRNSKETAYAPENYSGGGSRRV